jgi:MFS family permease
MRITLAAGRRAEAQSRLPAAGRPRQSRDVPCRLASLVPGILRVNRDFRLVYLSQLASWTGSAISAIAYPLLVLSLHGTAVQAGSVATVSLLTRMVLRIPAGQLADRWNRRTVMLCADLMRAAAVGSIPLAAVLGVLHYPQLVAIAVVEGTATAAFSPAADILTKDVVSQQHLADALGLSQSVQAATYLAGPAIGGALFAAGPALPFAADAASYVVSAVLVWRITVRPPGRTASAGPGGAMAGIKWLIRARDLLTVLIYASVINLVSAALEVLAVIDLRAHGTAAGTVGLILACTGIGAICGSAASALLIRHLGPATILSSIGLLWSVGLAVLAADFSPWTVGIILALLMTLSPAAGVVVGSTLLARTPRELLGRVSAATSMLLTGLAALGPLVAGATYNLIGPARGWLALAVLAAAATALSWLPLRRARLPSPAAGSGAVEKVPARSSPETPDLGEELEQLDDMMEIVAHQSASARGTSRLVLAWDRSARAPGLWSSVRVEQISADGPDGN